MATAPGQFHHPSGNQYYVKRLYAKITSPNLETWLTNLKAHVAADGPAQVTADTALIDTVLNPVEDAVTQQGVWMQAEGTARTVVGTHDGDLRDLINRYKTSVGWTKGMAEAWQVKTHTTS